MLLLNTSFKKKSITAKTDQTHNALVDNLLINLKKYLTIGHFL